MVRRNYDINRNIYSSARDIQEEEYSSCYYEDINKNLNNDSYYRPRNMYKDYNFNYYSEDMQLAVDEDQSSQDNTLLAFKQGQVTELVTAKSPTAKITSIKNTYCEVSVDKAKLLTVTLPNGSVQNKCIIQATLIFTISYCSDNNSNYKAQIKFLMPYSDCVDLSSESKFNGNVTLKVEDIYAKSIDGRNVILSALITSLVYGIKS